MQWKQWEEAVQNQAILNSAADGAEWSVSSSGDSTRGESSRYEQNINIGQAPVSGTDAMENETNVFQ